MNYQVDSTTAQIGSLAATCSGNPYEGVTFTINTPASTEGFSNPLDEVGPCTDIAGCTYDPSGAPQFLESLIPDIVIPDNVTSDEVQAFVNDTCLDILENFDLFKLSDCSAELRLSGDHRKNKHPGSTLSFDFMTNTTLVPGTL